MSFFRYFANLNGQYLKNGWSDFQFLFFKCVEFNLKSPVLGQILDNSHNFSEKLIFRPGKHEIGNAAKFWRDGKKRIPDFDSATQNCTETSDFVSGKKRVNFVYLCYHKILLQFLEFNSIHLFNKTQIKLFELELKLTIFLLLKFNISCSELMNAAQNLISKLIVSNTWWSI